MVGSDTLFQTKTAKKNPTFWHGTYLYGLYKGLAPQGEKRNLQIMSLAAYASETNKQLLFYTMISYRNYSEIITLTF